MISHSRCFFIVLIAFGMLHISSSCLGQRERLQAQADSLKQLAENIAPDTAKFQVYEALASVLLGLDEIDSARRVAERAFLLVARNENPEVRIRGLFLLAACLGNYGTRQYEKSLAYAHEGAAIAEEHQLYDLIHDAYSMILNLYFYSGDFARAMEISKKGLEAAEKHRDSRRISQYHNLFGFIYLRQGNYQEAYRYFIIYSKMSRDHGDSMKVADSYNCLGEVWMARREYQRALALHLRAWQIYRDAHARKLTFKVDQLAYTAFMISHAYRMLGDFEKALRYTEAGFAYNRTIPPNEYDLVN
ncbi:MAG TPA: tetratricopeptide repeat protein, partial [Chryseosolibacter sp.]|nr:tetratricopeptide repeat protein [Chryseosolibacter sp.]